MSLSKTLSTENIFPSQTKEMKRLLVGLKPSKQRDLLLRDLSPNYLIKIFVDGIELVRNIPKFKPSLILVESDLPGISGFQVAQLVKGHPDLKEIPVVLIISQGYRIGEFWSKEVGVEHCQPKPTYEPSMLAKKIEKLIEQFDEKSIKDETWSEINKKMSGDGVLASLSAILDDRLLQSTVANRIGNIAQNTSHLRNLQRAIMILLKDILEFNSGAIYLFKANEIYSFVEKDISEKDKAAFLEDVIRYSEIYRTSDNQIPPESPLEVPLGTFPIMEQFIERAPTIFTVPLETHKATLGTLTLMTFKAAARRGYYLRFLDIIVRQISLVLDNALLYQEVHRLSTVDELTGLPNRRAFFDIFMNEYVRSKRFGLPLSVAIIDIDLFKQVNDTYGHLQGDHVLAECAKIFSKSIREKIDIVARFGGEEFIMLLPQTDMNRSRFVLERLRKAIEEHHFQPVESSKSLKITVSMGLTGIDGKGEHSLDEIVNAADKALYKAKELGRNRIEENPLFV